MVILLRSPLGPLLFIAGFGVRPLVFFPASLITLVGGAVYGPVGVVYVLIGANLSSTVAYMIGRWFEADVWEAVLTTSRWKYYVEQVRRNSFEAVLIGRFLPIPLELDTYVAGFLRIDLRAYLLACALASIPGTIPFVLAGTSVPLDMQGGTLTPRFDPWALALAIIVLGVSLIIARILRRRAEPRGYEN